MLQLWISTIFLLEVRPEMICTLFFDTPKWSANLDINSLLALPFSGLDLKATVISLPLTRIVLLGLNLM
jgi:hypothetical protein